ncbi:MAG TPA: TonB-dependent receptor, partial [Thermoanaerobaculia bacterium]|nr:TonB-dependent receptor [Thermoanaerobaculia bacterium]
RAVAGVRYDGKTKLFDAKTSPRLALVYTPNERLVVRGGYSTAFRFPNFSELYQASWFLTVSSNANLFPAFPFVAFAPNAGIKPEEIRTFDLGAEYQLTPTVSAKADLFRSRVNNFIVITAHLLPPPATSTIGWENQPAAGRVTGGEFELRANFTRGLTGFANWSHQSESRASAALDTSGTPLEFPYAPKDKMNVGIYGRPYANTSGAVELAWKGQYDAPSKWVIVRKLNGETISARQPSYALVNARANYDLPFGTGRPIRLSIFGNNLLDKRVEETVLGEANRIAGREFFAQLEVHF